MLRCLVFLAIVIVYFPVASQENRFTQIGMGVHRTFSQRGSDLYRNCRHTVKDDAMSAMFCDGYIVGAADALSQNTLCVPPEVDAPHLIDLATKYMEDHPQELQDSADLIVKRALRGTYACKQ
jgi:hypothetical protein